MGFWLYGQMDIGKITSKIHEIKYGDRSRSAIYDMCDLMQELADEIERLNLIVEQLMTNSQKDNA